MSLLVKNQNKQKYLQTPRKASDPGPLANTETSDERCGVSTYLAIAELSTRP